jgi:hypothetical protein
LIRRKRDQVLAAEERFSEILSELCGDGALPEGAVASAAGDAVATPRG